MSVDAAGRPEPEPAPDILGMLLLRYSEWLDINGLMRTPKQSKDNRTHDQLVTDFRSGKNRQPAGELREPAA